MADLATPSGAAMFDGASDKKQNVKPTKPDEAEYKANLQKAEKEHADAMTKFNAVRAKLDLAQPKNKDSPQAKRREELLSQLRQIREQQAGGKTGRNQTMEQIKRLDEQLKSRIAEQKTARSRVSFKNVEELDREIKRLEEQVDTGRLKLVDEKKNLAEISNLRKQRKNFGGFDEAQKGIDDTKAKIKNLRDSLDDPESKALSDKYNKIQAELDTIKSEQDNAYKNINSLRDEREKLYHAQQEKYASIKKLKDEYWAANKAVKQYEWQSREKLREKQKAEREAFEREKKRDRANKMLAEASDKAYLDEIRRAESLLRFFDPNYTAEKAPLQAPSQFQAQAQRTVDDSGLKGVKMMRKDEREEDYFKGTGGKKGKKGKKGGAVGESPAGTPPASGKFNCPPAVMEDCNSMGIEPPMSAAEIPETREKVKAKLDFWKKDQDAQTEKNIAKAKKEIEKVDAQDAAAETESKNGTSASTPTAKDNGESKATASVEEGGTIANEVMLIKEAVDDVVADLKGASIEDKTE